MQRWSFAYRCCYVATGSVSLLLFPAFIELNSPIFMFISRYFGCLLENVSMLAFLQQFATTVALMLTVKLFFNNLTVYIYNTLTPKCHFLEYGTFKMLNKRM